MTGAARHYRHPNSSEDLEDPAPDAETRLIESTVTVRAFRTLPERWQTVLWYTEVEGMDPAEAAPYLGLTANSAAALAYRAREGLKKAWLQAHVSDLRVPPECRWTTERMGDYVRGALTPRARDRFQQHLGTCSRCSIVLEEVDGISGRLAAVLLPATLGGIAGAALLAQQLAGAQPAMAASASTPSAGRPEPRRPRRCCGSSSGGRAVLATGALAANGVFTPNTPVAQDEQPTQTSPPPREPEPTPTPSGAPEAAPPPPREVELPLADAEPPAPVETPVTPPPADTTPPLAPAVVTPANGLLSNVATPAFSGTGEPGALVAVQLLDAAGDPVGLGTSAIVDGSGRWATAPYPAVPDGEHHFRITQADSAGNRSAPASIELVVDTAALPPTIDSLSSPLTYLPLLTGAAEPGGSVELGDELGAVLATAQVGADGSWSVQLDDPGRDGQTITATLTDAAGNVSPPSAGTGALDYLRPTLPNLTGGMTIPSSGGATTVDVQIAGIEDARPGVHRRRDDRQHPHAGERPDPAGDAALTDGAHTIGVRYYDPDTGSVGSVMTVGFTIVP